MSDTLSLLRLLGDVPNQTLSRGEASRNGISDKMISTAQSRNEIIITSVDNTRDGEQSSLASLMLTDIGEAILDQHDD